VSVSTHGFVLKRCQSQNVLGSGSVMSALTPAGAVLRCGHFVDSGSELLCTVGQMLQWSPGQVIEISATLLKTPGYEPGGREFESLRARH